MKTIVLLLLLLPACVFAQSGAKILTNEDVVKLSKLDLPSTAIISKIQTSRTHFDVDIDALVDLKKQGVSGDVITAMINANVTEQKEISAKRDYTDPKTMRNAGIYYYNEKDANNLFVPIDPTVISSSTSGGAVGTALAQRYTYGLAKNKARSSLSGPESRRQISESSPTFYFYFYTANGVQLLFASGSTPNEFALVKLIERDNSRDMIVGSANYYENNTGIDNKQRVDFDYVQLASGVYKVVPKEPLERGEYCFIYTGAVPTSYSNNKVFDFGIDVDVPKAKK